MLILIGQAEWKDGGLLISKVIRGRHNALNRRGHESFMEDTESSQRGEGDDEVGIKRRTVELMGKNRERYQPPEPAASRRGCMGTTR